MSEPIFVVLATYSGLYYGPSDASGLETEVLYGERVRVIGENRRWAEVITELDDYPGFVSRWHLVPELEMPAPTHMVSEPQVAVYREPNFKSAASTDRTLFMNARVHASSTEETPEGTMREIGGLGWVFEHDLRAIGTHAQDFVAEAMKFCGTRYRWGWRSRGFVDCSSLLQAVRIAAGFPCPRNVGQQVKELGEPLEFANDFSNLLRGDLVFWTHGKGRHVAIMLDETYALHATIAPPYRGTIIQPLQVIIADQARDDNGPVTAVRRFPDYEPA